MRLACVPGLVLSSPPFLPYSGGCFTPLPFSLLHKKAWMVLDEGLPRLTGATVGPGAKLLACLTLLSCPRGRGRCALSVCVNMST